MKQSTAATARAAAALKDTAAAATDFPNAVAAVLRKANRREAIAVGLWRSFFWREGVHSATGADSSG